MDETNLSKAEAERAARLKSVRMRQVKKIIIWIVLLAAAAGAIYGLAAWLKYSASRKPGEAEPVMASRDHIPAGSAAPEYNSNPPVSGPHYPAPANWGVYDHQLPDQQLVHNLEHGGIWISYKDPNDALTIAQLKSIVNDYSLKVIMTPRPEDPDRIDVAAWGRILRLDHFDEQQIRDFIGAFINRGPEQVPY
jgi:hypothetical protein